MREEAGGWRLGFFSMFRFPEVVRQQEVAQRVGLEAAPPFSGSGLGHQEPFGEVPGPGRHSRGRFRKG